MTSTRATIAVAAGCALLVVAVAVPRFPHAAVIGAALVGSMLVSVGVLTVGTRRPNPQRRRLARVGAVLIAMQLAGMARAFRVGVVHPDETASRQAVDDVDAVLTNPRVADERLTQPRGRLVAADGTVLAFSRSAGGGLRRVYDEPSVYSLVGYVSPLKFGLGGLEASLDDALTGTISPSITDALGRALLGRAGKANTVHLSIDMDLQRLAAELLDGLTGSAIVIEYSTGRILAIVSAPTIDPNQLSAVDADSAVDAQTYWGSILLDSRRPLLSRATTGLYPPGSTFKVITAAAAIELAIATPESMYEDTGELEIDGRLLLERNRPDPSRSSWSLSDGLAYSLNLVYAQVGLAVGAEQLSRISDAFGIGDSIPTDLPAASGQIASSPTFLGSDAALADTAFGQGELLVTPLHMALVASAIARDGTVPIPTLVDRVTVDDEVIKRGSPAVWRRAVTPETARTVDGMMVDSATFGYARTAAVEGLRIGAKTGTAESGREEPHSWFIGYRSGDDSPVAVAVCIEFGGEGGGSALEIGRALLSAS